MRTTRRLAAAAVGLVLGLTAGCGGNDTADPGTVTEQTGSSAPDDTDAEGVEEEEPGGSIGY